MVEYCLRLQLVLHVFRGPRRKDNLLLDGLRLYRYYITEVLGSRKQDVQVGRSFNRSQNGKRWRDGLFGDNDGTYVVVLRSAGES